MRNRASRGLAVSLGSLLAACSSGVPATSPTTTSASPPPSVTVAASAVAPSASVGSADIEGSFDVGGRTLWITCRGSGSPTIVFEAGLGGGTSAFSSIRPTVAATNRACLYDRASIGRSQPRPEPRTATAGQTADDLIHLLAVAGIDGPVVLVAHSYGGAVARLVADRAPELVRGLVLVDAVSGRQFDPTLAAPDRPWRFDPTKPYLDGNTVVDRDATAAELAAITSLGSVPLAVLTEGQMNGAFERDWSSYQDELATLSTNAVHVVARDAGHGIHEDAPDLVLEAIREIVPAVRDGSPLAPCGAALERVGATCLASTMTARLATWDATRDAVRPAAGSFPSGTYRSELTGEQSAAVMGEPADFRLRILTWTIAGGHWTVSIVTDGGEPEMISDLYSAAGGELTLRTPDDWRLPGTPGVNRLRWTSDSDGTIHLKQVDDERLDDSFVTPWTRIGDA